MLVQGKYRVTKCIGEGSFSRVYEAIHDAKGTTVAIKMDLKQNTIATKLMNHEIKMYMLLKKKNIQNIVPIKSYGKYDDHMFLIMEKLPYTLNDYIQTENDLKNICNQMYIIIQTLHSHGIMHRDIKPENFMVSTKGKVYLIDLGLSSSNQSNMKDVIGSYLYCSFECLRDPYTYSPQCDMVSLFYVIFDLIAPHTLPWNHVCIHDKSKKKQVLYLLKKYTNYKSYYESVDNPLLQKWVDKYTLYINSSDYKWS